MDAVDLGSKFLEISYMIRTSQNLISALSLGLNYLLGKH